MTTGRINQVTNSNWRKQSNDCNRQKPRGVSHYRKGRNIFLKTVNTTSSLDKSTTFYIPQHALKCHPSGSKPFSICVTWGCNSRRAVQVETRTADKLSAELVIIHLEHLGTRLPSGNKTIRPFHSNTLSNSAAGQVTRTTDTLLPGKKPARLMHDEHSCWKTVATNLPSKTFVEARHYWLSAASLPHIIRPRMRYGQQYTCQTIKNENINKTGNHYFRCSRCVTE